MRVRASTHSLPPPPPPADTEFDLQVGVRPDDMRSEKPGVRDHSIEDIEWTVYGKRLSPSDDGCDRSAVRCWALRFR